MAAEGIPHIYTNKLMGVLKTSPIKNVQVNCCDNYAEDVYTHAVSLSPRCPDCIHICDVLTYTQYMQLHP